MGRAAQELEDKHPELLRVATTLVEGSTAAGYPLVVVMEEDLPLEGLMDTPTLEGSPLELQEDHMVVWPQGAPMVSRLQIPMVPNILGLMDRDLLQVAPHLMWIPRLTPGSSQWTPITVATSPSRS